MIRENSGAIEILIYTVLVALMLLVLVEIIPVIFIGIPAGYIIGDILFVYVVPDDSDDTTVRSDSPIQVEKETETIVPYEDWPTECYGCGESITDDMDVRGQFVVHKGESVANTKAVGLCDECTWTGSTVVDNMYQFTEPFDGRDE